MTHSVPRIRPESGGRRPPHLRRAVTVALLVFATAVRANPPAADGGLGGGGGHTIVALHAEGAQVYECRADATGTLAWRFREPRAVLTRGGAPVGRHYAGPTWELGDGSAVVGRVEAQAPGATAGDIALLTLDVVSRRGRGELTAATQVRRLNTHGGAFAGRCDAAGAIHAEPYTADYVFSKPS